MVKTDWCFNRTAFFEVSLRCHKGGQRSVQAAILELAIPSPVWEFSSGVTCEFSASVSPQVETNRLGSTEALGLISFEFRETNDWMPLLRWAYRFKGNKRVTFQSGAFMGCA